LPQRGHEGLGAVHRDDLGALALDRVDHAGLDLLEWRHSRGKLLRDPDDGIPGRHLDRRGRAAEGHGEDRLVDLGIAPDTGDEIYL
jgi:hypothetical protein